MENQSLSRQWITTNYERMSLSMRDSSVHLDGLLPQCNISRHRDDRYSSYVHPSI